MSQNPSGAGVTETADTRNSSMKGTPAPKPLCDLCIQQPQPLGDRVAPAVRD